MSVYRAAMVSDSQAIQWFLNRMPTLDFQIVDGHSFLYTDTHQEGKYDYHAVLRKIIQVRKYYFLDKAIS